MNLCFKNNLQNFKGRYSRQFYYLFLAVEKQINLIIGSRVISVLDRETEWSQMLLQSLIQETWCKPRLAHFKVERGSSEIRHNCGDGKNLFETGVKQKKERLI